MPAVARGILCNALVCLAVWLTFSARTTTDRILAIVPPITAFVAAGFEHSIANMYFLPLGMMLQGDAGQPVEGKHAVGLRILHRLKARRGLKARRVGLAVVQCQP